MHRQQVVHTRKARGELRRGRRTLHTGEHELTAMSALLWWLRIARCPQRGWCHVEHAPATARAVGIARAGLHSRRGLSPGTGCGAGLTSRTHYASRRRCGTAPLPFATPMPHYFADARVGRAGVAYVAPVLAFNLQLVLHLSTYLGASRPQVFLQPVDDVASVRSARVSLVREPADAAEMLNSAQPPDTTEELDAALRVHFATPRLLAQGDVFTVPVVEHANDDAAPRLTHFKVVSAEPRSGLMCEDSLTLVLDGSTAAAAPPVRHLANFCQSCLHMVPRTAHPAVEQLCRLVAPLMHPSAAQLRLRVSVLLKGPTCVGKRAVAHALADALGMNIVVYNCHELAPGGGGCVLRAFSCFETAQYHSTDNIVNPQERRQDCSDAGRSL